MKDKILEILENCKSYEKWPDAATKIESYIKENYVEKEFFRWLETNCLYNFHEGEGWFLLGEDGGNYMITPDIVLGTTPNAYNYWLKNIHTLNFKDK